MTNLAFTESLASAMISHRRYGLAGKVFAISATAILVSTSLSTAWRYWDSVSRLETESLEQLDDFLHAIQPSLIRATWQLNSDSMEVLLAGLMSQKGVVAVDFQDVMQNLTTGDSIRFHDKSNGCPRLVTRDYSQEEVVGHRLGSGLLKICFDRTELDPLTFSHLTKQMYPMLLSVLLSALAIAMSIFLLIVGPLQSLVKYIADGLDIGNYERYSTSPIIHDELDELIGELKKRTRQLSLEKDIVEMSLTQAKDIFVQTDNSFNIIRSNSVFENTISTSAQGKSLLEYFDLTPLSEPGLHSNVSGPDGRQYELSTTSFGDKELGGFIYVIRDLTEKNEKQERAIYEEKMKVLGTLSSGVAHDYNNILAGIMGNAELILAKGIDDVDWRNKIENILDFTQRGASLSNQLLSFARRRRMTRSILYAEEIVDKISTMTKTLVGNAINICVHNSGKTKIEVDRGLLESAVINLIINARDAVQGRPEPEIKIRTHLTKHKDEKYIAIDVSDNGTGIPADKLDRIFEPFFTTKGRGKGSGLGLAMVSGFIAQSGGHLRVDSHVDKGTTVSILLPISHADLPIQPQEELTLGFDNSSKSPSQQKILIIEDENALRGIAETALQGAGYSVVAVASLSDIVERNISHQQFDLIISDVILENCTAIDVLKHFRETGNDTPFALISGNFSDSFLRQIEEYGKIPCLDKPYRNQDLLEFTARVLSNNKLATQSSTNHFKI